MKPASNRGFGTKSVFGANFVSTSPNAPSSKLPSTTGRPLDSLPLAVSTNTRRSQAPPQVPPLKPLMEASQDSDVPDVMPWYNGETAHDYAMHLLALSGSDAFVADCDLVLEGSKHEGPKKSGLSKLKGAVLANSFLNTAAKKSFVRADNPKALAAFKTLSALSDEEKLLYPSWMTEGDIQTRKFLAQKIVAGRNRMRALMIRADEMLGTDDLRETLAKKYGLNEATYTEVADMISNNRIKVKSVFDDIHAVTQEQQSVLQEVQRALASTNTDLNFEISNLEDRLDDLNEDSLLQDAEKSLGHAKSMRIKLSTSHSRFLDQAVERLTTKMPQVVKTRHMEQDLILAADSLETMRKTVHECKASTLKFQKEAQDKSEALKLCQKELAEVSKDRDRLAKIEKELRSNVDIWREKFYQCDRDLTTEVRRSEEAERQHAAILEITLRNAQKVVEDRIEATARAHAEQLRKLNSIMSQLEHDLMYEKRLRDPDAVLKNAEKLSAQQNAPKSSSIMQQLEDLQSENEALQRNVDKLISEVNLASDEKESLHAELAALTQQFKTNVDLNDKKSAQMSEMQGRIDNMTSLLKEFDEKIDSYQSEREKLEKAMLESHEEILVLKSKIVDAQESVTIRGQSIVISHEKVGTSSVGIQTMALCDTAANSTSQVSTVQIKPAFETIQRNLTDQLAEDADPSDQKTSVNVASFVMKPLGLAKVMCGTQTDAPYPRIGEDTARLAIACTRPECLAKVDEVFRIKENANVLAESKAQEASSTLANQLAARDREHKSTALKLKKEMDVKLAFERESFNRAQNQLEQFRGAVKSKLETAMVEIKKMKRIGDFSNVGEVELHLNDVYIGATENFDAYKAEINARNQEASMLSSEHEIENRKGDDDPQFPGSSAAKATNSSSAVKNSKLGAASKAIMFSQAASKALKSSSTGSGHVDHTDAHQQIVSVDELKSTAERFIYATQQFMNGCSFGINSSSVSLERTQKKISFCVDYFRGQKKLASDVLFQLNLDLKDFQQKYEDSQMVIKNQAAALVRAERDCRFLVQKLSVHEEVDKSDFQYGRAEDGSALLGAADKNVSKISVANSKTGKASKTKASDRALNSKSDSKTASKSLFSESEDPIHPHQRAGSKKSNPSSSLAEPSDENLSACELPVFDENGEENIPVKREINTSDLGQSDCRKSSLFNSVDPQASSFRNQISESAGSIIQNNMTAIGPTDFNKQRRRHLDELKPSTVSCIYQESANAPPLLDFATHVELGSLRNAQKVYETKLRKLELLLDDKQEQLQHCIILMQSSARDQARSQNHAIDLSLEVHSERSKLDAQLDVNAELSRKVAALEEKLKSESQALVAVKVQESIHVQKLNNLTQKMQSFYQRCEHYVQEERAPFLSLFCEFWTRLGLLKQDIDMVFALDTCDVSNFRSSASHYASHDESLTSFAEMLSGKSLPQLRDEVIHKFGICCHGIVVSLNSLKYRHGSVSNKKEDSKIPLLAAPVAVHPANTNLPKISKHDASLTIPPQFAHKQLLPTITPKMKLQTPETISLEDALYRNSDDIVEKLTSKLLENKYFQETDANKALLTSWAKLSPAGASALKPGNAIVQSMQPCTPNVSPPPVSSRALYSIQEETS
jgi:hypothetical protein